MNNDLISRSELKKAIEQGEGFSWDSHGKDDLCVRKKYIDNAPKVPLPDFKEGYKQAIIDGKTNFSRPQDKWLHPYKTNIACECSNCHMQMPITDYFNFCPNCGADMRKGED